MGRKLALCIAMLTFQQANANPWFAVSLNCNVTATQAVCVIANNGGAPMFCNVRADGQLATGQVIYAYINDWVYPGHYRHAYVFSSYPNPPIVNAHGAGYCSFTP
ncbi:hypothetical protein A471_23103 [Ectopseudomonas mendocina DLHK]|nr:hypothetical protein A471_23103 [Pseudomonas mendocina DLHK]